MSRAEPQLPLWQRLLARPRLLHRLATWGLILAALATGGGAFLRADPAGVPDGVRATTSTP